MTPVRKKELLEEAIVTAKVAVPLEVLKVKTGT